MSIRRPARAALAVVVALSSFTGLAITSLASPAQAEFADLNDAGVHRSALEALDAAQVMDGTGCTSRHLCPQKHLPRWAMAVWLVRVLDGSDPPSTGESSFTDVGRVRWWSPHVERLFELGITKGCAVNPARFCPSSSVTRAQMASFLQRAFALPTPEVTGEGTFVDTSDSVHRSAIDAIAAAGISVGCATNPARFCPSSPVTRAQMASFLHRAMQYGDTVTWLSAGDSYSSGVGADPHGEGPCRRSMRAAGPAAAQLLGQRGWQISHTHTACEGAVVADMFNLPTGADSDVSMWDEHVERLGGASKLDVIALSLGGNDLDFSDVVLACVPFAGVTDLVLDCPSEPELRGRIDDLRASLSGFYVQVVSQRLTDRGRLYVIGYPSLIAPSREWRIFDTCRVLYQPGNVNRLSRLADYLNEQLAEAVRAANESLGEVRVHYVDTFTPFRQGRHEVCGSGSDYLHGITHVGLNPLSGWHRSFHPNNAGHAEIARLLAEKVESTLQP